VTGRDGGETAGGPREAPGWDTSHLRGGLVTLGVLAVLGAPAAWGLRDGRAALWVLVGLAIVAAFFSVSALAVAWAGRVDDQLTLPAALGTYLVKIVLLGVLLTTARDASWVDGLALAWSVLAGTLAWVGVQVRRVWTSRLYYVDP
jgi:ATP synthase protein I